MLKNRLLDIRTKNINAENLIGFSNGYGVPQISMNQLPASTVDDRKRGRREMKEEKRKERALRTLERIDRVKERRGKREKRAPKQRENAANVLEELPGGICTYFFINFFLKFNFDLKDISHLYLDGNNMMFVATCLRNMTLQRNKKRVEQLFARFAVQFLYVVTSFTLTHTHSTHSPIRTQLSVPSLHLFY